MFAVIMTGPVIVLIWGWLCAFLDDVVAGSVVSVVLFLTRLRLRPTRHAGRLDSLCLIGLRRSLVANWDISVDCGG